MNEEKKNLFCKIKNSRYLCDWEFVLFWIICFELLASIVEYATLSNSSEYVEFMPDSVLKEFIIALMVVAFVCMAIYNLIFVTRTTIIFLIGYSMIGIYLLVTGDYTLNFIFHNINIIEIFTQDPLFVSIIQFFFKVILIYLTFRLYIAIVRKYREKKEN